MSNIKNKGVKPQFAESIEGVKLGNVCPRDIRLQR